MQTLVYKKQKPNLSFNHRKINFLDANILGYTDWKFHTQHGWIGGWCLGAQNSKNEKIGRGKFIWEDANSKILGSQKLNLWSYTAENEMKQNLQWGAAHPHWTAKHWNCLFVT